MLDQTYNTPALATIFLLAEQLDWMNANGGLEWTASRCDRSAEILYTWAEQSGFARPFVENPADRSHVVGTIDFVDAVDAVGRSRPCCGPTGSSTPSRIASSGATSCGSPCSRRSSPTTSRRCAAASPTSWGRSPADQARRPAPAGCRVGTVRTGLVLSPSQKTGESTLAGNGDLLCTIPGIAQDPVGPSRKVEGRA